MWWFEYAWPMVNGNACRCGLVGIDVDLLEELDTVSVVFEGLCSGTTKYRRQSLG